MSGSSLLYTVPGAPAAQVPSWLVGVPQATLQQWLGQAQTAYQALVTGTLATTVSYAQGTGNRAVTYTRTNQGMLAAHIRQLQTALGIVRPRRAARVRF